MKLSKQQRINLTGFLFILPSLSGFILFVCFPFIFSFILSFTKWDYTKGLSGITFNGGINYLNMWKDEWFLISLKNTFLFSLGFVTLTMILALIISIILDRYVITKRFCQLCFFLPHISNIVAASIVWVIMLSSSGPVTMLIRSFGVENPPKWLGNTDTALPSIIVMSVWLNVGYLIMIYTAALKSIPKDLYESSAIDGANDFQQFIKITIPMIKPTTFFLLITTIINSFKVFGQVNIMTRGGPGNSTSVLVYYIYTSAFKFFDIGYAAAMSWVLFAILFIITLIQLRGQKSWSN